MSDFLAGMIVVGAVGYAAYELTKKPTTTTTTSYTRKKGAGFDIGGLFGSIFDSFGSGGVFGSADQPATIIPASSHPLDTTPRPTGAAPVASGGLQGLLDLIGAVEAPKGYNQVYGGIRAADHPPKPLTSMTVQEVLNWQDGIDSRYPSEAAGRYQVMEDTLRGLVREGKVDPNQRFDERTQDGIAVTLAERRGLNDFRRGKISDKQFAQNLSKEWASLPAITTDKRGRTATGQSYYAGDGLNRSHVRQVDILAKVRSLF